MTETNNKTITNLPTKECEDCARNAPFIHQLHIDATFRRLCTACVLRQQPGSFCPVCLTFYGGEVPPTSDSSDHVACSKPHCLSLAHSHCVGDASISSSYLCPTCNDSFFSFFPLDDGKIIDEKLAKALVCASKIAAENLKKASVRASAEAERKAKEAAEARKRATEAIERLQTVTEEESAKKKGKEKDYEIVPLEHTDMDTDSVSSDGNEDTETDTDGGGGDGNVDTDPDTDTDGGDGDGNVDMDGGDGDGNVDTDGADGDEDTEDPSWHPEDNLDTEEDD